MSLKARISRLAFAVGVAGLISAQIPLSGGTAMADDDYNLGGGNSARVPIEIAVIGLVGYGIFSTFTSGGASNAADTAGTTAAGTVGTSAVAPVLGSVYDVAKGSTDNSTFADELDKAAMKKSTDEGTYTVFAPSNQAFSNLPPDTLKTLNESANQAQLQQVLQLHIVPGHQYSIMELKNLPGVTSTAGATLPTMSGGAPVYIHYASDNNTLAVSSSAFSATNAGYTVTQNDIPAKNSIVHPISGVLLPSAPAAAGTTTPAAP